MALRFLQNIENDISWNRKMANVGESKREEFRCKSVAKYKTMKVIYTANVATTRKLQQVC